MHRKFKVIISAGVGLLAACCVAAGAAEPNPFPDGPGRDSMILACSQCHSIGKMLQADLNADDWRFIVYDMVARGAPLHVDEVPVVTQYLQDNFATDQD